jgi:hypothetical protein
MRDLLLAMMRQMDNSVSEKSQRPPVWRPGLVAVRAGVAIFADLFLGPLARQGLFYAALFTGLQVIRMALYLFDNVFGLDLTFKPAQRVFQRLAFL